MENKLNLLIIGANGGVGRQTVLQSLEAGHHVTAMVRNAANLTLSHSNLQVVIGDVMVPGSFEHYVKYKDVVISTLGIPTDKPTTLYSKGNENILNAMKKFNVNRIFCISASAIEVSPQNPLFIRIATKLIVQKLFGNAYADQRIMEKMLKESDTNYTVIRPPRLLNKPLSGKYRFAINKYLKNCFSISRADVAHFIVNHILDSNTYKTIVEVGY